nr:manganese catalase family protein [Sulfobacillus harzensis]
MFKHEDVLLFPVEVSGSDPSAAAMLQEQFGGANGELKALLQYLVQSFGTPDPLTRQLLLNIAVEEASHLEIVGTAIVQLMAMDVTPYNASVNLKPSLAATGHSLKEAPSLVHKMVNLGGVGPLVVDSSGAPFTGNFINSTGDIVSNLMSDVAAELRAGRVYHQLRRSINDPGLNRALEFLEEREATHSTMFAEAVERVKDEGIVSDQGYTVVAQRPPALSEPFDQLLAAMAKKLPGAPLDEAIGPDAVPVQLATGDDHLLPLS